jgi:hypothetical protein
VAANGEVEVKSGGVFFLDGAGGGDNGSLAGTIRIKSGAKSYSTGTFTGNGWTVIEAGGAADAVYSLLATRTVLEFSAAEQGQTVYVALSWQNEKGEEGTMSEVQSAVIP